MRQERSMFIYLSQVIAIQKVYFLCVRYCARLWSKDIFVKIALFGEVALPHDSSKYVIRRQRPNGPDDSELRAGGFSLA